MPYRTIVIIAAATILGIAGVTSDALAFRGGSHAGGIHAGGAGGARGARVGAADHDGMNGGSINRGSINRGAIDRGAIDRGVIDRGVINGLAAYGAYRRPGVAVGVGAGAVGAAAVRSYYNSACGSYPCQ